MSRMTNLESFDVLQQNVTTSGTPVQLPALSVPPGLFLIIKAKNSNTGIITVGSSSANALNSGSTSIRLNKNDAAKLSVTNANLVWIDSTVTDSDGIEYYAGEYEAASISSLVGDVAAGVTDSGNPIKIGGKASSSTPTAVANGQRVNAYFDTVGRLHVGMDSVPVYTSFTHGSAIPSLGSITRLPSVSAAIIYIKAANNNLGKVYIGNSNVVALGGDITKCGYELAPGEEIKLFTSNLNSFYYTTTTASDFLTYFVQV